MSKWSTNTKRFGMLAALLVGGIAGLTTEADALRQTYCENNLCNGEEGNCELVLQEYNCDEIPLPNDRFGCEHQSCGF